MEPMSDAPMINFSPNFCPLHCTRDIARDWIAKEVDSPLPYEYANTFKGMPEERVVATSGEADMEDKDLNKWTLHSNDP
ncbi:Limkainb1like, partial [Caligus rogercresseyi]